MFKRILIFIGLIIVIIFYFNLKDEKYILNGKSFYVQDKGVIKLINSGTEKLIYNSNNKTIVGKRTIFSIDNKTIIIELLDGIYLYNNLSSNVKKIMPEGFTIHEYSHIYESLIVTNNNKLYLFNVKELKLKELINNIRIYNYALDIYTYPILINDDEVLYITKSKKMEIFNIKNNTFKVLEKSLFNTCYPLINIRNDNYICKMKGELYKLNINTKNFLKLNDLELYSNYIHYINKLDAVMYTKLSLSLMGEKMTTRIYFLKDGIDYLWSDEYLQPSFTIDQKNREQK